MPQKKHKKLKEAYVVRDVIDVLFTQLETQKINKPNSSILSVRGNSVFKNEFESWAHFLQALEANIHQVRDEYKVLVIGVDDATATFPKTLSFLVGRITDEILAGNSIVVVAEAG